MSVIKQLRNKLLGNIYPITKFNAVYDDNGNRLSDIIGKMKNSIKSANGSLANDNSNTSKTICSITINEPGAYLILGYHNISKSLNRLVVASISVIGSGARTFRGTGEAGGGMALYTILEITEPKTVALIAYCTGTEVFNHGGSLTYIKLS